MFNMNDGCCFNINCSCSFPPPFAIIDPWRGETVDSLDSIEGRGTPGATIHVRIDGKDPVYSVTVKPDGTWNLDDLDLNLTPGKHIINAIQETGYGCARGCEPFDLPFTVGQGTLASPIIRYPANGATLMEGRLYVSGSATPGNVVTICLDGLCSDTVADENGVFSKMMADPIGQGVHFVTATEKNYSTGQESLPAVSEFSVAPYMP